MLKLGQKAKANCFLCLLGLFFYLIYAKISGFLFDKIMKGLSTRQAEERITKVWQKCFAGRKNLIRGGKF